MVKNMRIRQEQPSDYKAVFALIEEAFRNEEYSDHHEHFLVERLRKSDAFVPELSLVAEANDQIVGHILLTRISIGKNTKQNDSLALAPVSVLPLYQNKGVGGKLIMEAHRIAAELGFRAVILLGHKNYYPRFGYKPAHEYGIELPFDVPREYCMARQLRENGLKGIMGTVHYAKEFYE